MSGIFGEGCYFQGLVVLAIPTLSSPETIERFHPKNVRSCGNVNGGLPLSTFLGGGGGSLVNVPYFPEPSQPIRIEGERVNYLEINQNVIKLHAVHQKGSRVDSSGSTRGTIKGFSPKARARMIQRMASLARYPNFWQDFTFADDVMDGIPITGRAHYSSWCLCEFKRWLEKNYPEISGIWRREWEDRKSGGLLGQLCPHFHCLLDVPGLDEVGHQKLGVILGSKWFEITGSKHPRGLMVAINRKSYRCLENKRQAQIYVAKYVAKEQHALDEDESLGRFYGWIGRPQMGEIEFELLTESEEILIRRFLRRFSNRKMRRLIASPSGFWVLVSRETIHRLIDYVRKENIEKCQSFP